MGNFMQSLNIEEKLGLFELDVKDIAEKYGSMNDTTKCCATGTCDNYIASDMQVPTIPTDRDQRNAFELAQNMGYLA